MALAILLCLGREIVVRRVQYEHNKIHGDKLGSGTEIQLNRRSNDFFTRPVSVPERGNQRALAHALRADERKDNRLFCFFLNRTNIELLECRPDIS